jgi:hypothetical protein
VLFHLVGTYAGSYQWHGSSSPAQLRLEITDQQSLQLSGFCTLGDQRYPLLKANVDVAYGGEEAPITFTVDVPASQGQQPVTLNFSGSVTKEGSMSGVVTTSEEQEGTWSVKKVEHVRTDQ